MGPKWQDDLEEKYPNHETDSDDAFGYQWEKGAGGHIDDDEDDD
jgi:hypothetical protein